MTARNMAQFSEYDFHVLIDRSGSMAGPAHGFPSRWAQAKELTEGIAGFASQVDDDGITVIQFGGRFDPSRDVQDGVKADAVHQLFETHQPAGSTPLAGALDACFKKHFSSAKKTIAVIVTDGQPDDEGAVANAIIGASRKLADASQIRILFLQVGDDKHAAQYLDNLDNHLEGAKFDIVNAINFEGANGLSVSDLMDRAIDDSH